MHSIKNLMEVYLSMVKTTIKIENHKLHYIWNNIEKESLNFEFHSQNNLIFITKSINQQQLYILIDLKFSNNEHLKNKKDIIFLMTNY